MYIKSGLYTILTVLPTINSLEHYSYGLKIYPSYDV